MFRKVLVANRGEIANRLFRACRELGVGTVAVFSDVDREAPWIRLADESYPLPGKTAAQTYLNQEAILDIAVACGAQAIHPGYGFLSENAGFAEACAARGITFIGPGPEAMRLLGSKAEARAIAQKAGVPVVPGVDGAGMTGAELQEAAEAIGYPVLIKASAGGGGKGMRIVDDPATFADALQAARSEASSSFGDDHILIEKYFTHVHHVEIQILGDQYGNLVHLFERECSVQRRHQKIIEESPAPILPDDAVREAMAEAALSLARAVGYVNAGTIEFVVDGQGQFYFLEMNTRLQVEHPVTELVTGIDLGTWQIRVAAGEQLSFSQADLVARGHAIECRVYAEDPAAQFLPSIGRIAYYRPPAGPGVRVDDGVETGAEVTPYYDPMLAKVITWGADRSEAIRKMVGALQNTVILGVTTNIPYLLDILDRPAFREGRTSTTFLDEEMASWQPAVDASETTWLAVAALEALQGRREERPPAGDEVVQQPDPWKLINRWRNAS